MLHVRWWGLNIQEFITHIFFFQQANKEGILKNANVIKVNGFNSKFFGMGGLDREF